MSVLGALFQAAGGTATVALRALVFVATIVAAGTVVFRLALARTHEDRASATPMGWAAAMALVLAAAPRLWLQARGFVDVGDPVTPMMANVLQTGWGRGWLLQLGGAAMAGVGFVLARRATRVGELLAILGVSALCLAPALMGHAAAVPSARWLAIGTDAVHVAAAASWTGTLAIFAWRAPALLQSSDGGARLAAWIERFHRVALGSAALLVATGAAGVWLRVQRLGTLLQSDYGLLLFAKLVAVGVVVALGAWHSRRAPACARQQATTLAQSLQLELFFALVTVIATAVLVGTSPEPDA